MVYILTDNNNEFIWIIIIWCYVTSVPLFAALRKTVCAWHQSVARAFRTLYFVTKNILSFENNLLSECCWCILFSELRKKSSAPFPSEALTSHRFPSWTVFVLLLDFLLPVVFAFIVKSHSNVVFLLSIMIFIRIPLCCPNWLPSGKCVTLIVC